MNVKSKLSEEDRMLQKELEAARRYGDFYREHEDAFESVCDLVAKTELNKRNLKESDSYGEYELRGMLSGLPKCMVLGEQEFEALKAAYVAAEKMYGKEVGGK